jgi:hypothetical protein
VKIKANSNGSLSTTKKIVQKKEKRRFDFFQHINQDSSCKSTDFFVFIMSLIFDEYGRPFIILREQQQQARIKGIEAQKGNILAARCVSNLLRTSLGPKGILRCR